MSFSASAWQNPTVSWLTLSRLLSRRDDHTSELLNTLQHQANELANLRVRLVALEAEREAHSTAAAREAEAVAIANAEANAADTAAATLIASANRRGAAGGRVRARDAMRWSDGTFASYREADEADYEAYLPFARAGEARAARAQRDEHGRFLPNNLEIEKPPLK
jgi:hypothetical protein